jgi:hypothetical protein
VASPVAGRIPATCTALGKALLAHNPVAIEDATRSDMVRRTRHSITQAAVLQSQLAQVRRVGFAFEYQEARIGLACVASPVMTGKSAAAAISITGPSDSFDPLLSARGVRTAARCHPKRWANEDRQPRADNKIGHQLPAGLLTLNPQVSGWNPEGRTHTEGRTTKIQFKRGIQP